MRSSKLRESFAEFRIEAPEDCRSARETTSPQNLAFCAGEGARRTIRPVAVSEEFVERVRMTLPAQPWNLDFINPLLDTAGRSYVCKSKLLFAMRPAVHAPVA